MDLEQRLQDHIEESFSFLKNKKLLIGASGGLDSTVCINLFHKLNYSISVAHCNFNLREKDSDLDEIFVRQLTEKLRIPFYSKKFNTKSYCIENKTSTQIAARELRYHWFDELLKNREIDYLITAHHLDDSLETFLINLSRGTGLDGLTGIPAINGNIIRPLLPFTRVELERYAEKRKLSWREDLSNEELKYTRNKVRHKIIPVLKQLNPNLMMSFAKTTEHLNGSKHVVEDRIKSIEKDVWSTDRNLKKLNIEKIINLSKPKSYLFELLKKYGFTEWDNVYDLLNAQSGKTIQSNSHQLLKDRKYLILSELPYEEENELIIIKKSEQNIKTKNLRLNISITREKSFDSGSKDTISVDKNLLNFPLIVRRWEKGDYFYPIGMQGKKKLSKYFKDEKISVLEKKNIWLLCTNDNDIVWVIGRRLDDRFKITEKTIEILKIENEKFI